MWPFRKNQERERGGESNSEYKIGLEEDGQIGWVIGSGYYRDSNYFGSQEDETIFKIVFYLVGAALDWNVIEVPAGKRVNVTGMFIKHNEVLERGQAFIVDRKEDESPVNLQNCVMHYSEPRHISEAIIARVNEALLEEEE